MCEYRQDKRSVVAVSGSDSNAQTSQTTKLIKERKIVELFVGRYALADRS
jgi:hypothetical protein